MAGSSFFLVSGTNNVVKTMPRTIITARERNMAGSPKAEMKYGKALFRIEAVIQLEAWHRPATIFWSSGENISLSRMCLTGPRPVLKEQKKSPKQEKM